MHQWTHTGSPALCLSCKTHDALCTICRQPTRDRYQSHGTRRLRKRLSASGRGTSVTPPTAERPGAPPRPSPASSPAVMGNNKPVHISAVDSVPEAQEAGGRTASPALRPSPVKPKGGLAAMQPDERCDAVAAEQSPSGMRAAAPGEAAASQVTGCLNHLSLRFFVCMNESSCADCMTVS